jgi:DNA-binding NtrC family response regulator
MEPSKHLLDAALNYPWPGNLRELENFVKRYVILEDDEGSLRELVEMSATRQRTSPREEVVEGTGMRPGPRIATKRNEAIADVGKNR